MKLFICTILLVLLLKNVNAVDNREVRLQMRYYLEMLFSTNNDSSKIAINSLFNNYLKDVLAYSDAFYYSLDSIPHIGILWAPDKKFRILNWNIQFSDGTYKYFGFIQSFNHKDEYLLSELVDKRNEISEPEFAQLSPELWYGALYYEIIHIKDAENEYYTLLGWDGNNDFSNKKIIEILYFNKNGGPKFGKSIFKVDNKKRKRIIFEYSYLANMMLRYNPNTKMIVFDHLAAPKPSLVGNYKFYGPDFTHDGLEFKNGKWVLVSNLDLRNINLKKDKPKKLTLTN